MMQHTWIVLLDHSSSMGNPFNGKRSVEVRSRSTQESVKLAAAKRELLRHMQSLGKQPVILIGFTSTASLIFTGQSDDDPEIRRALDALRAENGTDIAAALDFATQQLGASAYHVLVITDGL